MFARLIIWFIASLFLLFDILLRVFPNIIVQNLQTHFHINAAELGNFSASYMWAYGIFQIPASIIIGRYGVKPSLFLGAFISALAVLALPFINDFDLACADRFIMGCGASFAFLGCMQVIFEWFEPKQHGKLIGFTMTVGALGGIICNSLLTHVKLHLGWIGVIYTITTIGIILAILITIFVKNNPQNRVQVDTLSVVLKGLWKIIKSPNCWVIALISGFIYLPYAIFNDLWGESIFRVFDHLTLLEAGNLISAIWLGWMLGSPVVGTLSDWCGSKLKVIVWSTILQIIIVACLVYLPLHSLWALYLLALLLGASASAMFLCYILAQENADQYSQNSSVAFVNAMVSVVVFLSLPLIGKIMDMVAHSHHIAKDTSVLKYPLASYQASFAWLVVCLVLVLLGVWVLQGLAKAKALAK